MCDCIEWNAAGANRLFKLSLKLGKAEGAGCCHHHRPAAAVPAMVFSEEGILEQVVIAGRGRGRCWSDWQIAGQDGLVHGPFLHHRIGPEDACADLFGFLIKP